MLEILIIILAFSGLVAGFIINKYVKKELKQGRQYFIWAHKAMIVVFILLFLYSSHDRYLAIIVGLVVGYFLKKEYFYLGAGLAGGFYFMMDILAALIFLHGLVYSAVNYKGMNYKKILNEFFYFLMPFLILLISFGFFGTSDALAFSAGALIWRLR